MWQLSRQDTIDCKLQGYFCHFVKTYLLEPADVFFIHLVYFSLFSISFVSPNLFFVTVWCLLYPFGLFFSVFNLLCFSSFSLSVSTIKRELITIEFHWIYWCCVLPQWSTYLFTYGILWDFVEWFICCTAYA